MVLSDMGWNGESGTVYVRSAATESSFASHINISTTQTISARPPAPTTPPTTTVTSSSITITAVEGQEYRLETEEETWQSTDSDDQVAFSDLTPGTEYTIWYRAKAVTSYIPDNNKFASHSASTTVTTERAASTLTIKVTPSIAAANGINALTAQDNVELYNGEALLASSNTTDADGSYTLTYDTQDKGLSIGSNTLTANYSGSGSLEPSTATVAVTLKVKEINASLTSTTTKTYDGTTSAPEGLTIELTGVLDSDDVAATGTVAYDTKDVGESKTITASNLTLTGANAAYYNLTSSEATLRLHYSSPPQRHRDHHRHGAVWTGPDGQLYTERR